MRQRHRAVSFEASPYVPRKAQEASVPRWKQMDAFRDVLPGRVDAP